MLKQRKLVKLGVISLSALFFATIGLTMCYSTIKAETDYINRKGDERFFKTIFHQDARLETGGDEILVVLHDFTEKEKYYVKQSIREIDYLSDNLNYVFSDEENFETDQVLNIYNNCELDGNAAGQFKVNLDERSATMQYPLEISLEGGLINYVDEFDRDVRLLSAVVTHEVMHTLGFNDLRTDRWLGQSIMYWNIDDSSDHGVNKMTESDRQAIIDKYGPSTEEIGRE